MEDFGIFELLLVIGISFVLGFTIGRGARGRRRDDTYGLPMESPADGRARRMQALKDKSARKAAIKPELELTGIESVRIDKLIKENQKLEAIKAVKIATGTSLKNAKDYVDARADELR